MNPKIRANYGGPKKIYTEFNNLDASRKKALLYELSSSQRKAILSIISRKNDAPISKKTNSLLTKKIIEIKSSEIPLTTEKRKSSFFFITKKILQFIDELAYFFGFLTANKAYNLICRSQNRKEVSFINESQLKKIILQAKQTNSEEIKLADLLRDRGIEPILFSMELSDAHMLDGLNLDGITFQECELEWASFKERQLKDITFQNCDLSNINFRDATLENCDFIGCEMREVMFTGASLDHVAFLKSSLITSSFEDASINNTTFIRSSLTGTHFLSASVENSSFNSSNLENALFFGTLDDFTLDDKTKETAVITKPVGALLINPDARGITVPKVFRKIDTTSHLIPLRIALQPPKVDFEAVNKEVDTILESFGPYDRSKPPIPQRLIIEILNNPEKYPEATKIYRKAELLSKEIDAFFLPGGEDIQPELYGEERHAETKCGDDYRRSLLELCIINRAFNKGIPMMALCRGFQMSNIYFGAQLAQDVKGHVNMPQEYHLKSNEYLGLYSQVIKKNFIGISSHHQAVPVDKGPTEFLAPAVEYEGLVKASEAKEGTAPMVLLQFHPEYHDAVTADSTVFEIFDALTNVTMSKSNDLFFKILSDSAETYRKKRALHTQIKERKNNL